MELWLIALGVLSLFGLLALALAWFWARRSGNSERPFSDAGRIPTLSEALPQIEAEISRARRFEHTLSAVVFKLGGREVASQEGNPESEVMFLILGTLLREEARIYDVVTFDPSRDQYVLFLVESDLRQAQGFVRRISRITAKRTGLALIAGIVEFPYGGVTVQDLVARATEKSQVRGAGLEPQERVAAI